MKRLGSDIVVKALEDEGVRYTFGIPGTHNTELYDALDRSEKIVPILVCDERGAAFMGDGYSQTSEQIGVLNLVPGAGLTHALSGIGEAYLDNIPLVVLACGIRRDTGNAYQLHDVDQLAIVRPLVKKTFQPKSADEIYPMIREAFHEARSGSPGPVAIEIAANFYFLEQNIKGFFFEEKKETLPQASKESMEKAIHILSKARSPALYVGNGARGASDLLVSLAQKLSSPVVTTLQGKGVFPEDHPLWLWNNFGRSAPDFVQKIMGHSDALLAIGCRFSEVATGSYGFLPPQNLIHVDISPEVFSKNYSATLSVHSDAKSFVMSALEALPSRSVDHTLEEKIAKGHELFWKESLTPFQTKAVTPAHFFSIIQKIVGEDAIYLTDSGNGCFLAMEFLRLKKPGSFLGPIDYSCMGYSVPAAIGASLANPERPVVAFPGDGAFLMTGLELLTATHYGLAPMIFVLRDQELGQIAQFQRIPLNRTPCTILPPYDLEKIAQGVGAQFLKMDQDGAIEEIVREAQEKTKDLRPVVVEVAIDYSRKTYFTRGVVKTNLLRYPFKERLRVLARAATRHLFGKR